MVEPTAEQRIRMAALQAAATLLAPTLGEMAATFRMESAREIGGGAIALADRFEQWIRRDAAGLPKEVPNGRR